MLFKNAFSKWDISSGEWGINLINPVQLIDGRVDTLMTRGRVQER